MHSSFPAACLPDRRKIVTISAFVACLHATPPGAHAHHGGHELSVPSQRCGWIGGEDLRDRRNLADFCEGWTSAELRIAGASAARERLWIEAPPDLASLLREDDRSTAALLHHWLERWRQTTGYSTASVVLLRGHIELARIQTTMKGEVVMIR